MYTEVYIETYRLNQPVCNDSNEESWTQKIQR